MLKERFARLCSPTDFETAQNLAKLKEATTSPQTSTPSVSAIDYSQLAKTVADQFKTLIPAQPKTIATLQNRSTSNWSGKPNFQGSQSGEHQQEIRTEMRNFRPQKYQHFFLLAKINKMGIETFVQPLLKSIAPVVTDAAIVLLVIIRVIIRMTHVFQKVIVGIETGKYVLIMDILKTLVGGFLTQGNNSQNTNFRPWGWEFILPDSAGAGLNNNQTSNMQVLFKNTKII